MRGCVIEIRDKPQYPDGAEDGLKIEAKNGTVQIEMTWDGAVRMVVHIEPETLAQIAFDAQHWPAPLK
jgi:hypothetical protein